MAGSAKALPVIFVPFFGAVTLTMSARAHSICFTRPAIRGSANNNVALASRRKDKKKSRYPVQLLLHLDSSFAMAGSIKSNQGKRKSFMRVT